MGRRTGAVGIGEYGRCGAGGSRRCRRFQSAGSSDLVGQVLQVSRAEAEKREGGFRLDEKESALGEADSGEHPIVPGDLEASDLYQRLIEEDPDFRMPRPTATRP